MKRILFVIFCALMVFGAQAQGLRNLETNPTFKGITVGMPVSKYMSILRFVKNVGGKTVYTVTDPSYSSVFGIRMDYCNVVSSNGKVYCILAVKDVRDKNTMFTSTELDAIQSGLERHYGRPTHSVYDGEHFGVQWISSTKKIDDVMTYLGTGVGYTLMFAISEYKEDY